MLEFHNLYVQSQYVNITAVGAYNVTAAYKINVKPYLVGWENQGHLWGFIGAIGLVSVFVSVVMGFLVNGQSGVESEVSVRAKEEAGMGSGEKLVGGVGQVGGKRE